MNKAHLTVITSLILCFFQPSLAREEAPAPRSIGVQIQAHLPAEGQVLINVSPAKVLAPALPTSLSLMTWNVHKGEDANNWATDFLRLSRMTHVWALQEAMKDSFMPRALSASTFFDFWMAESFEFEDGRATGVATGARALETFVDFRRSPGREPILHTPKVSLISIYPLEDQQQLMVINIHGINFVFNSELRKQLEDLRPILEKWTGPVVFLGDFNTWNPLRTSDLSAFTRNLKLEEVRFARDPRGLHLDHMFVRGCRIRASKVFDHVKTSDHYPLWASIDCQKSRPSQSNGATPIP